MRYSSHVIKIKFKKKSNILIVLPVYKTGPEIFYNLKSLLIQKKIRFDILLIDNGSSTYKKVSKVFSKINYIVFDKNIGHAGAQFFGAKLAIRYKYDYVIFTVDDVSLINKKALSSMKKALDADESIGAVMPVPYLSKEFYNNKPIVTKGAVFCYFFVKTKVIKKVGLFNPNLFIYGEDAELSYRISDKYKILKVPESWYFLSTPGQLIITSRHAYFCLRGLLHVSLISPRIKIANRIMIFYYYLLKLIQTFLMFVVYKDRSYLTSIYFSILGAKNLKIDFSLSVLPNKYYLSPIAWKALKAKFLTSHSLLRKCKYYYSYREFNKKQYYEVKII